MAIAPQPTAIGIRRHFTTQGVHPYDEVVWERRDARITNFRDGSVAFEQLDVEVPVGWSLNATNILAQKYFRGTPGTPEREWSLKQVADRVADTITAWGMKDGYFADSAEAVAFRDELKHLIVHQKAAFNSPVWFNIGVSGVPQQASACQPFDALVSTPEGSVPIGELVERNAVGTKVFDAHGITRIVAVKHNGRKNVLRIRTTSGLVLDVTPDHLVWRASGSESGSFVQAGELRPGDLLTWHPVEAYQPMAVEGIESISERGETDVYDIQTESGEYLSGGLRVHNCFILSVDDSMDSILNWYTEEGVIFKGGSGSGVNLSRIRASVEPLKGGGTASGPVSFMRGADASAGTIKSGGKTRRAAKMVILDVDHPDVFDFIWCKAIEERKARALRDAGFDMDLDGADSFSIQYQNANNSVRVTDEFMQAVIADGQWDLVARTTGRPVRTVRARDLFRQIAHAAWECADPGLQYDSTINRWHTAPNAGRINGSNPCSEYMHLDNSACNLASLNLLRFLGEDGTFDVDGFEAATEVVFTAQEILVGNADYPTKAIAENSRRYRQLGIGYANLGALLMAKGLPYDSDAGRAWAAAITALLTGHSYETSARIASRMGPFAGFHADRNAILGVLRMHGAAVSGIDADLVPADLAAAARRSWDAAVELGEEYGVRNAQASVLAPTGTIGLLMDCDTTGVEPDLGLVKTKKLVGGGTMSIVNQTVPRALAALGYDEVQIGDIVAYIDEHKSIVGAPHLAAEHLPVFACSMGDNTIHYQGHIKMMGAVQPFISGAISKTINMPEEVTVEDVEQLHMDAWRLGIKAVAIYRDNCKVAQPLSTTKKEGGDAAPPGSDAEAHDREVAARIAELEAALVTERSRADVVVGAVRERLPRRRRSNTFAFRVSDCEGYVTVGEYDDGRPGEVFMKVSKQGSTLAGIMDAFSISVSLGLQHGVPLATYVRKYTNMRFEPAGITDDNDLRIATSLVDYIFRRLALDYLTLDERAELGVMSTAERIQPTLPGVEEVSTPSPGLVEDAAVSGVPPATATGAGGGAAAGLIARGVQRDAPMCYQCGNTMQRAGSCYVCASCGTTSGCS